MISKTSAWLEKPENITLLLRVFYGFCAILVMVDLLIHRHIVHDWENLPAFYAMLGFVVCVSLVFIAKILRLVIIRKQDYYDV